jgi:hypothetical protein
LKLKKKHIKGAKFIFLSVPFETKDENQASGQHFVVFFVYFYVVAGIAPNWPS